MNRPLTVGELREQLADLPDYLPLYVEVSQRPLRWLPIEAGVAVEQNPELLDTATNVAVVRR